MSCSANFILLVLSWGLSCESPLGSQHGSGSHCGACHGCVLFTTPIFKLLCMIGEVALCRNIVTLAKKGLSHVINISRWGSKKLGEPNIIDGPTVIYFQTQQSKTTW